MFQMGCIFLSVFFIPDVSDGSVVWMNYALCVSTAIAIPLVLLTKEKYVRSDLDDQTQENTDISESQNGRENPFDELDSSDELNLSIT